MMTGNGRFRDLEHVVIHAADGGLVRFQEVRAAGHSCAEDNKFGHRLLSRYGGLSRLTDPSQTETWGASRLSTGKNCESVVRPNAQRHIAPAAAFRAIDFSAFQSSRGILQTAASNRAGPATLPDDIEHRKSAWFCGASLRPFDRSD